MITGLVCGGLSPLDAAICGVYLHGKAADLCAERKGQTTMLPHDIWKIWVAFWQRITSKI